MEVTFDVEFSQIDVSDVSESHEIIFFVLFFVVIFGVNFSYLMIVLFYVLFLLRNATFEILFLFLRDAETVFF